MNAFYDAPELPKPTNGTLYCYKDLSVWHIAYDRGLNHPGRVTKDMFDAMRERLFEAYWLPRQRHFHRSGIAASDPSYKVKILLYAHEPSGRRVWNGLNDTIRGATPNPKYEHVEFETVYDFGQYSTREQATLFNAADVHIMAHGAQMGNAIFTPEKTVFFELGCLIPTFIGKKEFMALIDGRHRSIESCDYTDDEICVVCETNGIYANFTMTQFVFEAMLDLALSDKSSL